jgi:predicted GIY-YIG superfamily endonuclease
MGSKKTVKFTESGIGNLSKNKPVVYKILTENNRNNYTGIAKRGRVQERITEHLGKIPGAKVQIEQMNSIRDAGRKESSIISRSKPKYNKAGK